MSDAPNRSPEQDHEFHSYTTHHIPWYVRLLWVGYWILCVWYVISYVIPAIKNHL